MKLNLKMERENMETKHTPGPWTCHELGDEDGSWERWSIVHNGPLCYGGDACQGPAVSEANARLIAAAPELLEACEAIALDLENNGELYETDEARIEILRAAIAKAKGE